MIIFLNFQPNSAVESDLLVERPSSTKCLRLRRVILLVYFARIPMASRYELS